MNAVLEARFSELIARLALGIALIDAGRQLPPAHPIAVALEGPPFPNPLPVAVERELRALVERGYKLHDVLRRIDRHASGRHVLLFERGIRADVVIRIFDVAAQRRRPAPRLQRGPALELSRRVVPRRLRIPMVDVGDPPDLGQLDVLEVKNRTRRPVLFPGAAYNIGDDVTGVRGRVVYADASVPPEQRRPVRWARVEARRNGNVVARAHGDDRGEFLLVVPPQAVTSADLPRPLAIDLTVFGPPGPVAPPHPVIASADPFWDLPVEVAEAPGVSPDGVMDGVTIPTTHTLSVSRNVSLTYGRIVSVTKPPFELT